MLFGIDISSHQKGIELKDVPCAFVLIKATQGTDYVNPDLKRTYNQAKKLKKLVGFYHYASNGGSTAEAKHFLDTVASIKATNYILVLDWEKGSNANWGDVAYAQSFLDYVKFKTGITPFIYMPKNATREFDWSKTAKTYPLWAAQYRNYVETGYQENPWTDNKGFGAWEAPLIYQFTSAGKLNGWDGHLDLNVTYMDEKEWKEWATPGKKVLNPKNIKGNYMVDTSEYPMIRKGHKNEWVRLLQNALNLYEFDLDSDGIFGILTDAAVRSFQKQNGLTVDGVVGPATWRKLFP